MAEVAAGRAVESPLQGTVVSVDVGIGDEIHVGRQLLVLESMKMEHVIVAEWSGVVARIPVKAGDTVFPGDPLVFVEEQHVERAVEESAVEVDIDHVRDDLAAVVERHSFGMDAARPEAVERRRRTGQRTTRENVDDLVDPGTFVE